MAKLSGSSFLWQIVPGLDVQPLRMAGRVGLVLTWTPPSPPRGNDLGTRIMLRLSGLQALHPKAHPLALLAKAVSEIHPYAKAVSDRRGSPLNNPRRMV
jgi:hypothetical protein